MGFRTDPRDNVWAVRDYDAITLDMGGTLVDFGFDVAIHMPPGMPAGFLTALGRHRRAAVEKGHEVDLCAVMREAGADDPAATTKALIQREVATMSVYPETLATLGTLRERGYQLVILSNVWTPGAAYASRLRELGVWDLLDGAIWSFEEGCRKPNPELFRRALEVTGSTAARTAHVGDKRTRDVKGAKDSGFCAVHVHRGPHPDDQGEEAEPDHTIPSLAELLELFP